MRGYAALRFCRGSASATKVAARQGCADWAREACLLANRSTVQGTGYELRPFSIL